MLSARLFDTPKKTEICSHWKPPKSVGGWLKRAIALSLRLYLDDCAYAKELVARLRAVDHDVLTPVEAGTLGLHDPEHLHHAVAEGRVLLTRNPDDFENLHREVVRHPGIVAIYQDNDPTRDMNHAEVVRALNNLESSGVHLASNFHILNA